MRADAYKLGNLDAALAYGLRKEAGVGSLILPVGLGALGTALGGTLGGGVGAIGGLAANGMLSQLFGSKQAPAVAQRPAPKATFEQMGRAALGSGKDQIWKYLTTPQGQGPAPVAGQKMLAAPKPKFSIFKRASFDVGGSIPLPGFGGLGMSHKDQRERLPGMRKWVPRDTMERAFEYDDQGFDPEAVMDMEAARGELSYPAVGGALAAAAAKKFMPKAGVGGLLLAGLGGAGLGSAYHAATGDRRRADAAEALEGAQRERHKFPISKHQNQTANESSPLAVSRGHGDA